MCKFEIKKKKVASSISVFLKPFFLGPKIAKNNDLQR